MPLAYGASSTCHTFSDASSPTNQASTRHSLKGFDQITIIIRNPSKIESKLLLELCAPTLLSLSCWLSPVMVESSGCNCELFESL